VLGLATGGTPVPLYRDLIRRHREEGLDFSKVRSFNLDEYLGLPPDHPASYRRFMDEQLFDHINIPKASTRLPDGLAKPTSRPTAPQYEADDPRLPAASTSRCWVSAPTATSASTSPPPRSPRAPACRL
jgi:6-phosphogluconolactonase/glucosamine-6-phosphate isomerase/deaminase